MSEYGAPFDLRSLPKKHFEAHMAILQGKAEKSQEQQNEQERKVKEAERKANRHT